MEGYYILTKGTSTKRTLKFLTLTHQTQGYTCVKETLLQLKSYAEPHTLTVVEIKTLLSPTVSNLDKDRDMLELVQVINQMDLAEFRERFPQTQKNTPSSQKLRELFQN